MKTSEAIAKLQALVAEHGDRDLIFTDYDGSPDDIEDIAFCDVHQAISLSPIIWE